MGLSADGSGAVGGEDRGCRRVGDYLRPERSTPWTSQRCRKMSGTITARPIVARPEAAAKSGGSWPMKV